MPRTRCVHLNTQRFREVCETQSQRPCPPAHQYAMTQTMRAYSPKRTLAAAAHVTRLTRWLISNPRPTRESHNAFFSQNPQLLNHQNSCKTPHINNIQDGSSSS